MRRNSNASRIRFLRALRRQHSAVESAINGLEHTGLDLCRDHGIEGFKRYVAMAVLARNIKRVGVRSTALAGWSLSWAAAASGSIASACSG